MQKITKLNVQNSTPLEEFFKEVAREMKANDSDTVEFDVPGWRIEGGQARKHVMSVRMKLTDVQ
nr:hypothetical protein [Alcaligenes faecalis]